MGATAVRPRLHTWLLDKEGKNVTASEMARALNEAPPRCAAALRSLIRNQAVLAETIIRGQAWKIVAVNGAVRTEGEAPEPAPEPEPARPAAEVYHYVGTTAAGDTLVKAPGDETVWKLAAL